MENHVLLISCRDQPGLVHAVTGVVARHGLNVVANGEFVDPIAEHFFMRSELVGALARDTIVSELRAALPAGALIRLVRKRPKRIVVLGSREPHCLGDLLLRHDCGELGAEIAAVISNHELLAGLVRRFDVPFHHVPHAGVDRAAHEARIGDRIADHEPEYLVLAKYMRIFSAETVARFPQRIVNIHHSFLPAFVGANPYRQAFERGVKIIGATAHFVTEDLDEGPIIAQDVRHVDHSHGVRDLAQAGREIEKQVLATALRLVFDERVFVSGNKTVVFE